MSHYGPPGGPYSGRGRDPQRGNDPQEPYTEPSDPWGDKAQDSWGRTEGTAYEQGYDQGYSRQPYEQHGYEQTGYDRGYPAQQQQPNYGPGYDVTGTGFGQRPVESAPGGWTPAPASGGTPAAPAGPPAGKSGGGGRGMILLVAALALLVCGGIGTTLYLLRDDNDPGSDAGGPTPTPVVSASAEQSAEPTPSAESTSDARFVKQGECVQNVGSEAKPTMKLTECATKGAYEVLARFDAPAAGADDAKKKCAEVEGYTNWYFFNSELDSLDFVLCLKQR